jgi:hypothetical protein
VFRICSRLFLCKGNCRAGEARNQLQLGKSPDAIAVGKGNRKGLEIMLPQVYDEWRC